MKKHLLLAILILIALILYSYDAYGEIYKWVDNNGKIYFTDNPPKNEKIEEIKLKINVYTSVDIKPIEERLGKKGKVVMYTASWCGICKKAKTYFVKNNIPHVTYDIETSSIGKNDFKSLKGKSIPIIILGKNRMNGFTIPRFVALYKKQLEIDAKARAKKSES